MVILIDNYDSFTYIIKQYLEELGENIKIIKNDEYNLKEIKELNPKKIIISPGPSTPSNAGISKLIVKEFYTKIPILGICLGHQIIAEVFGAKIIKAKSIMHGKKSKIIQKREDKIFKDIKKSFYVTRYHSLIIDKKSLNRNIIVTSIAKEDRAIMSIKIRGAKSYGVQFHPESILSEQGKKIFKNFLKI